eukprot:CAMPEP_0185784088 /NCGR_PEP_ID=MMETSP1174-20130828/120832_1 /TAXON_ID=35687 /ORGANISM="Dictyocha speculum, Strain CCMP1381" /LENGTH=53 /DNA_ID=CAMNT_0028475477 /DNA_START=20 /DNA_END=178 /DNA_ORIENTATION=+
MVGAEGLMLTDPADGRVRLFASRLTAAQWAAATVDSAFTVDEVAPTKWPAFTT